MVYLNPRRKILLLVFFWLFVFAVAAYSVNLHLQWIVLLIFLGVMIIVDFMFLTPDTFVYDPVSAFTPQSRYQQPSLRLSPAQLAPLH